MSIVKPVELPEPSLLRELKGSGSHTDCYTTTIPIAITQARFIEAFYTTPLFKAERFILRLLASKASTDQDASDLAYGKRDSFAVWRVAERRPEQLLLTDQTGRTRSWLMVVPGQTTTQLFFGSALMGRRNPTTGQQQFTFVFRALLAMHNFYSRHLLQAAAKRIIAAAKSPVRILGPSNVYRYP